MFICGSCFEGRCPQAFSQSLLSLCRNINCSILLLLTESCRLNLSCSICFATSRWYYSAAVKCGLLASACAQNDNFVCSEGFRSITERCYLWLVAFSFPCAGFLKPPAIQIETSYQENKLCNEDVYNKKFFTCFVSFLLRVLSLHGQLSMQHTFCKGLMPPIY